jgi:aspartyl protease family protein
LVVHAARVLCVACARRARRTRATSMAVGAVAALALVAFAVTKTRKANDANPNLAPTRAASGDYSDTAVIEAIEARLAKEPCDRSQMLALDEKRMKAGEYRNVIDRTEAFWKKCGPFPRLRWLTYEAHKQLSETAKAIDDATLLIAHDPNDKDYWWWRGIVYEETGDLEKAAADFRQSIAIEPRITGIPFNLANVYERLGRPCDAIFPIEQFLRYHPDVRDREVVDQRLLRLYATPECASLSATGRAVIPFRPGARDIRTVAKVGSLRGTFIVDTGASFTVVSGDVARKLALNPSAAIRIQVVGGIAEAKLVTLGSVEVQGARAEHVPAAVVDSLPGGVDGLLGLSFLSRFSLQMESLAGKLTLSARRH